MEQEYEKLCLYCEHASHTYRSDQMLCDKKGIVPCVYKCSGFIYDPLKRIPRTKKINGIDEKIDI